MGSLREEEHLLRRDPKNPFSLKNASVASRFSKLVMMYQVSGRPNFSPARRIDSAKYAKSGRPVTRARSGKSPFGPSKPSRVPWPPCDGQAADLAGFQELDAAFGGALVKRGLFRVARLQREIGSRAEIVRNRRFRLVEHVIADQVRHFGEIDRFDLPGEFILLRGGKLVPEAQELILPGGRGYVQKFLISVHVSSAPSYENVVENVYDEAAEAAGYNIARLGVLRHCFYDNFVIFCRSGLQDARMTCIFNRQKRKQIRGTGLWRRKRKRMERGKNGCGSFWLPVLGVFAALFVAAFWIAALLFGGEPQLPVEPLRPEDFKLISKLTARIFKRVPGTGSREESELVLTPGRSLR